MPNTFNCPSCGAPLDIDADIDPVIRCPYCKGTVVVPPDLRLPAVEKTPQAPVVLEGGIGSAFQQAAQLAEVTRLAQAGQKIEAIKLFRQLTGVGLKDAKDVVDGIAAGQPFTLSSLETSQPVLNKSAMLNEVARLVEEGKKLEAIKVYRETFDVSLAEAKAAVDKIGAGQFEEVHRMATQTKYIRLVKPPVKVIMPAATAETTAGLTLGCFTTGLIGFLLLVTIVPILFGLSQRGGPLFNTWARINPFSYANLAQFFGGKGTGAGLFEDARHVAVDPQTGNLIIAEHGGGRIQVFDPSGKFITQWNTGNADIYIVDLDIDRQGNVYVIYSADIHVLNAETGQEIATISDVGGNNAFFSNLATTDDGGFIAVSHGETLVRFNSDRTAEVLAPSAISSISGDSELDAKIAIDGVGNIYLLGIFNNSVFKFDSQGKFVTRFGSAGEEKGQFRAPHAIAVDNQSRVYVSDAKGIQVFEADGRYLDKFEVNGFVFGIDINDINEIFTVANDQKVSKFIMKVP